MLSLKAQTRVTRSWLGCGWRLFRKKPIEQISGGLVFSIVILAIAKIPVAGPLVAWLISPVLLAGWFCAIEKGLTQDAETGSTNPLKKTQIMQGLMRPFTALSAADTTMTTIAFAILSLAASIIFVITGYLISGNTPFSGFASSHFLGALRIAVGSFWILCGHLLLLTAFIHMLPQVLLADRSLPESFSTTMKTAIKQPVSLILLILCFLLTVLCLMIGFLINITIGIAVLILLGCSLLPTLLNTCYCSYRTSYMLKTN